MYSYAWCIFLLFVIFYVFRHNPDLPGLSMMTCGTPWELAHGYRPALTLDIPGSLGGFLGW